MRLSNNMENKILSDTYWGVPLVRSGTQCFRTTNGKQLEPDAFDESRFVMTFLTTFGVTEILCSFRLVTEGKTGRKIPESSKLEFWEKFLANNLALWDAEENASRPFNRGGTSDLAKTLLTIRQKFWEPSFWQVMDSSVLVAYANLAASRTFFSTITSLYQRYLGFRRFILLL